MLLSYKKLYKALRLSDCQTGRLADWQTVPRQIQKKPPIHEHCTRMYVLRNLTPLQSTVYGKGSFIRCKIGSTFTRYSYIGLRFYDAGYARKVWGLGRRVPDMGSRVFGLGFRALG